MFKGDTSKVKRVGGKNEKLEVRDELGKIEVEKFGPKSPHDNF